MPGSNSNKTTSSSSSSDGAKKATKRASPADPQLTPLKPAQKEKVKKSGEHVIANLAMTTKQLLDYVKDMAGKREEVLNRFETRLDEILAEMGEDEKKAKLAEIRAEREIDASDADDEADLRLLAATRISAEETQGWIDRVFGVPRGSDVSLHAVIPVYDPRPNHEEDNERIDGVLNLPQLNPDANCEAEFAPDSNAFVLTDCDPRAPGPPGSVRDASDPPKCLINGTLRTYRVSARGTGSVKISTSRATVAIALLLQYAKTNGLPDEYDLMAKMNDTRIAVMIRHVVLFGPSVVAECITRLSENDCEAIAGFDIRDLVGPAANPAAVSLYREAMRRAYRQVVSENIIGEDPEVEGSTPEDPLPEDTNLWKLVSSPAFGLLLPTCVWTRGCQMYFTSVSGPIVIDDIRSAVNRARDRVRLAREAEEARAAMVDDDEEEEEPAVEAGSSKGKGKSKSKGKGKGKGKNKSGDRAPIELIDSDLLDSFTAKLEKRLGLQFTRAMLVAMREVKGMPSKKASEAYGKLTPETADLASLYAMLTSGKLAPHERGILTAMLGKAKPKVDGMIKMARSKAEDNVVIGTLFKELAADEAGSTAEKVEVSTRSMTQVLTVAGMMLGKQVRMQVQACIDEQKSSVMELVKSLGNVFEAVNKEIVAANVLVEQMRKSEAHLINEREASEREAAELRQQIPALEKETIEAKTKSVGALEELKKVKEALLAAEMKVEKLEKENEELKAASEKKEEEKPTFAAYLLDDKKAAESDTDGETSDSDEEEGDDDASSAVFGDKGAAQNKSAASVLSEMAEGDGGEEEELSDDDGDEEEEEEAYDREPRTEAAPTSPSRGKKRTREEDESSGEDQGEAKAQKQSSSSTAPSSSPPVQEKEKAENLEGW